MGTDATETRRWSVTAAGFGADVYLFTVLSLAVWVLLPTLLLGWSPILVSSGSMSPAIEAGDLVLIDEDVPSAPIAPGAIITYREPGRDPDRLVTHRIRDATDTGVYTTRGDANIVDDARPVPHDQVVGYARLLVPLLGLPIHWARTDAQPALLAFAGVTLLALGLSGAAARQDRLSIPPVDVPQPQQTPGPPATVAATSVIVDRTNRDGDRELLFVMDPAPAAEPRTNPVAAEAELLFPRRATSPQARYGRRGSEEPSLWGPTRPVRSVGTPARAHPRAAGRRPLEDRTAPGRREQRARAARRRALQSVLFLLASAGLIASGISLPVTEAALTAAAPNLGNAFSTWAADPGGEPLAPELVLPPVDGQPSYPAGQQPETIAFDFAVTGTTMLEGPAVAVLRVRPSTPGTPPRSLQITLRHGGGEVLASAYLEQQRWDDDWTELTLTLDPDLDVTLPDGDTLTVEIEIRRLELDLDGGSVVRLPIAST